MEGEDLSCDDPRAGSEGGCFVNISESFVYSDRVLTEERDIDADERELGALRAEVGNRGCGTTGGNNILRNTHADGSSQKNRAASEAVDCVETREGHDDVDRVDDDLQDERVGKAFDVVREERGSVVDNEIDTDQLL